MLLAIRTNNKEAAKEYIADTANILMTIGNLLELYNNPSIDNDIAYEINKEVDVIVPININDSSKNQKIF